MMNDIVERHPGRKWRLHATLAGAALLLCACGNGGVSALGPDSSAPSDGNPPPDTSTNPPPSTVPGLAANGDLVEDRTIYQALNPPPSNPSKDNVSPQAIDDVLVVVLPPAPGGACTDGEGNGWGTATVAVNGGKEDYSGCTLTDVDGKGVNGAAALDHFSTFSPAVNVVFSADDYDINTLYTSQELTDVQANGNAAMSIRGASTRLASQKGYKIKLNKNFKVDGKKIPQWHNQRTLQLNKHPYDLTRIRNKLAFDLFTQVPDFVSLRTQFVHLNVAGDTGPEPAGDYGLFTHVEKEDDHWADAHGLDDDSSIFKSQSFYFMPLATMPELQQPVGSLLFETIIKSENDNNADMTNLFAMLADVNDNQDFLTVDGYSNDFGTVFQKWFHPDNFRTWLAVNILLSNIDTNSQNFYLYRPTPVTQFYFTPWDYDGGFDWDHQPGGSLPARWQEGLSNWWGMPLVRRYIMAPGEVQNLTTKIQQLYGNGSGVVSPASVQNLITGYAAYTDASGSTLTDIIQNSSDLQHLSQDGNAGGAMGERSAELARLPGTVAASLNQYLDNLNRPMPVYQGAIGPGDAGGTAGVVTLTWDASWDVNGRVMVDDVYLSTTLDAGLAMGAPGTPAATDAACTQQPAEPVPVFHDNLLADGKIASIGLPDNPEGNALPVPVGHLTPGTTYYLKVVIRNAAGYCQSAFDGYQDAAGKTYDGVLAFTYNTDGTVTILN